MGNISKNFSFAEFQASKTATEKGWLNVIDTWEKRNAIVELVEKVLQPLRDAWGKPLVINSGYRSARLNAAVGGVATSQHTKGEAADIKAPDPLALVKVAIDYPEIWNAVDQAIIYPTFVHFSHKKGGPQRHNLLYNKSYTGPKL